MSKKHIFISFLFLLIFSHKGYSISIFELLKTDWPGDISKSDLIRAIRSHQTFDYKSTIDIDAQNSCSYRLIDLAVMEKNYHLIIYLLSSGAKYDHYMPAHHDHHHTLLTYSLKSEDLDDNKRISNILIQHDQGLLLKPSKHKNPRASIYFPMTLILNSYLNGRGSLFATIKSQFIYFFKLHINDAIEANGDTLLHKLVRPPIREDSEVGKRKLFLIEELRKLGADMTKLNTESSGRTSPLEIVQTFTKSFYPRAYSMYGKIDKSRLTGKEEKDEYSFEILFD